PHPLLPPPSSPSLSLHLSLSSLSSLSFSSLSSLPLSPLSPLSLLSLHLSLSLPSIRVGAQNDMNHTHTHTHTHTPHPHPHTTTDPHTTLFSSPLHLPSLYLSLSPPSLRVGAQNDINHTHTHTHTHTHAHTHTHT